MQTYLGAPSHRSVKDIFNNMPTYDILSFNLEHLEEIEELERVQDYLQPLKKNVLLYIGSLIPIPFVIDTANDRAVTTKGFVLGYNMSIPTRVKYKCDDEYIFVTTLNDSGLIAPIQAGVKVYPDQETETSIGIVQAVSQDIVEFQTDKDDSSVYHTYGDNCPYDAPWTVTFNNKEYRYVGWNMDIMFTYLLAIKENGQLYQRVKFNSSENRNDWSASEVRNWLNAESESFAVWGDNTQEPATNTVGLYGRIASKYLKRAIIPTVNRIWCHPDLRSGKVLDGEAEHVVDKIRLMGFGNLNFTDTTVFKDIDYDTSKYTSLFGNTGYKAGLCPMRDDGLSDMTWNTSLYMKKSAFVTDSTKIGNYGGGIVQFGDVTQSSLWVVAVFTIS